MTGPREHDPRPTNLALFLGDLETLALSTLPEQVTLSVNDLSDAAAYQLDPDMLQDSLINLLLNARDACGAAGEITLTARAVRDTWLEFTVEDTGPGFSAQALDRALAPFFTTKGGEGSGLGLAMVYDMTKLAGGRVQLANTDAGGCVTLRLPLRRAAAEAPPGLVLLVEDNPDLRATVRGMLREAGHSVIEASTVEEARMLVAQLPEIAAVLSDISLGGEETGLDLLDALPRGHPPACLMTSLPPDDPLHAAGRARAPVLRKPFAAAELAGLLGSGAGAGT
jgi:CheY-like chemotaxis protein